VAGVRGKCRLATHLCFGNYKARAVGPRQYAPMFPAFFDFTVDEIHVEMASREFAELGVIGRIAEKKDVAVGIIDVKSYYIEPPEEVAKRLGMSVDSIYTAKKRVSDALRLKVETLKQQYGW